MTAKAFHLQIVELPVRNVKESMQWYTDLFGVDLCFPYNEGDDGAWLNLNGLGFGLIRSDDQPKMDFVSASGERKPFFTFQVDNIKELYEEMNQKGVEVKEMVYKQGGGYSFQFFDPSGNFLGIWGGWPKENE
ncbi:VOC family protein [Paenibacillus lutimineralis]|uniref:VOC family protein n=1 Tax=Paenibacillus lutimineralis TaxID=2707005 RepID=A0A3Q9IDK7_9BACL|nr:VOC family protein [Paenibacillus lutimineralis]AZS16758.1 VOC family protein [Paenibacillus lutimineralis]